MTEWSVYIKATRDPDLSESYEDERLGELMDLLADYGASTSGGPGTYAVQFSLEAEDVEHANRDALGAFRTAVKQAGLPQWPVTRVETVTDQELDEDLGHANIPDLVSNAEIADILGVSRQRAWVRTRQADFPAPIVRLKSGPLWLRSAVEAFAEQWDRTPGRRSHGDAASTG